MKVLIGCEFTGEVRDAFTSRGHYAVSCDLEPSESPGLHIQGDLLEAINNYEWDLLIAHPPCTHLSSSGARWFKERGKADLTAQAFLFAKKLLECKIERIAIENPVGVLSSLLRKPDQIIQPWQFGCGETKATCLWLKKLPPLIPTHIVEGREAAIHKMSPSKDRAKNRSRTYFGIAEAMADQWST